MRFLCRPSWRRSWTPPPLGEGEPSLRVYPGGLDPMDTCHPAGCHCSHCLPGHPLCLCRQVALADAPPQERILAALLKALGSTVDGEEAKTTEEPLHGSWPQGLEGGCFNPVLPAFFTARNPVCSLQPYRCSWHCRTRCPPSPTVSHWSICCTTLPQFLPPWVGPAACEEVWGS